MPDTHAYGHFLSCRALLTFDQYQITLRVIYKKKTKNLKVQILVFKSFFVEKP